MGQRQIAFARIAVKLHFRQGLADDPKPIPSALPEIGGRLRFRPRPLFGMRRQPVVADQEIPVHLTRRFLNDPPNVDRFIAIQLTAVLGNIGQYFVDAMLDQNLIRSREVFEVFALLHPVVNTVERV